MTLAQDIAREYELRQQLRNPFYTPMKWEDLPQHCRQEHQDIADAALTGTTYHGHTLPQWVQDLTHRHTPTPDRPPNRA